MYLWINRRLKENIIPLDSGLDIITNLKPMEYNFIGDDRTVSGLIAQDVQEIKPDWIVEHDDDEYITFDDKGYMQTGLVRSIQEQQEMIEQQEQEINNLQLANNEQQQQIDELKTLVCIDHPEAELCN